ncbi:MAG TPA: hypothetical protein PKU91_10495, partial [Phycisphaerales bacterium]|nr:hypothetical protein [Phycisphaerales bacterium]
MSLHEGLTSPSLIPQPGFLAREDVLAIRADVEAIKSAVAELDQKAESLSVAAGGAGAESLSRLDIFHNYSPILVIAFLVTLVATPLMRR